MSINKATGASVVPPQASWLSPTLVHLASGAVAGCLAKSVIAPFDRVKILSQVRALQWPIHFRTPSPLSWPSTFSVHTTIHLRRLTCLCLICFSCYRNKTNNRHYPYTGIFSTINAIYQREGISKLWVGNGATIIRIAPYAAIQFMTYEKAKQVRVKFASISSTLSPI